MQYIESTFRKLLPRVQASYRRVSDRKAATTRLVSKCLSHTRFRFRTRSMGSWKDSDVEMLVVAAMCAECVRYDGATQVPR